MLSQLPAAVLHDLPQQINNTVLSFWSNDVFFFFFSIIRLSHIMTRLMKVSCKCIIKTKSLQKQDSRARQLEK